MNTALDHSSPTDQTPRPSLDDRLRLLRANASTMDARKDTALTNPQPAGGQWPAEPIAPVGHSSRKAFPIKRNDAEPLTREDIQYDLLDCIFSDTHAVFTCPDDPGSGAKVPFSELYIKAIYESSKCSKVLKEKMVETPAFATELAKLSLLINVGRINTTMAFFPEMKTALRTYHSVPSLQKTDGNAQDAPRIKGCLKAVLLPSEFKSKPPSTPEGILERKRAGHVPPTSVVNLIFVLANHAVPLANVHFEAPFNFLDLFLPVNISSADRARAFLWLMYYYLERNSIHNPYHNDSSRKHEGKVPSLLRLTPEEFGNENVDTLEEIEWGKMMMAQRSAFLQKLMDSDGQVKTTVFTLPSRDGEPSWPHESPDSAEEPSHDPPDQDANFVSRSFEGSPLMRPRGIEGSSAPQDRAMLQHTFQIVTTADPFADSDEENPDELTQMDYYCTSSNDCVVRTRVRTMLHLHPNAPRITRRIHLLLVTLMGLDPVISKLQMVGIEVPEKWTKKFSFTPDLYLMYVDIRRELEDQNPF